MRKTRPSTFRLTLPATSANLGPAFDAAALAFDIYLSLEAHVADSDSIVATGRDSDICGKVENHLILTTYREVLQAAGKTAPSLALKIRNDIPIGKGCGSSAAARLAAIGLANHFGRLRWNDSQIVGEASRREQHPDNAAACWMGGITVARMSGHAEAQIARIHPKGKWPLLLAVPDDPLSTEEARRVLPSEYSRADAVVNIQNSMLLLAAFLQGRPELLKNALNDRIHQPYRAPLCPLLPALLEIAGTTGILGATLSGAGPSVLMLLDPAARLSTQKITAQVAAHLAKKQLSAELIFTAIASRGAASASSKR